jgi:hypothetical protein
MGSEDYAAQLNDSIDSLKADAAAWPEGLKVRMADDHPLVGDIVLKRITKSRALEIIGQGVELAKQRERNEIGGDKYMESLLETFADIDSVGGYSVGRDALLQAYAAYRERITAQTELLGRHAEVVHRYSQGNDQIARALLGAATNEEFQGTLLDLIENEDRKEKASSVFSLVGDLAKNLPINE